MTGTVTPVIQPNVTIKPTLKANGTPPVAEVKTPAPAAEPQVDYAAEQAKLKSGMDELARQAKRHAAERQKLSEERRAHEKAIAESKKWAAEREQLRLNPESILKAELGDDYYDKLTNMRLSGGAPPAALVQSEIQKLKADFEAKLAARDEQAKTTQQTESQRRADRARESLRLEAADFARGEGKDSALLVAYGNPEGFANALAQRIEAEYSKNPSKVLSTKEAVDLVESELFQLVEKVTATEKWKSRSTPNQSPSGSPIQQRRTLNNSTTGRTPGREPPQSDEERRERAIRAYNERAARNAG